MRFNDKYFSFPPYLSTSWNQVSALHLHEGTLIVYLNNGQLISIPSIKPEVLELIFKAHHTYLEKEGTQTIPSISEGLKSPLPPQNLLMNPEKLGEFPLRFGINPLDGIGSSLQHNPAMSNAPDLPKELIQKIASITKIVAGEEAQNFPKGEPHCNCFYCQIARGLHQHAENELALDATPAELEEVISEADLHFQQWEIHQCGDQLFTVTNRLDSLEKYSVYLGHPVGCTCGQKGCEHILAVLRT